jgi:hypothetical protein
VSALTVEFCGERHKVEPDAEFSFGRAGDLEVDDNPYLHRVMGVCFWRSGWWWLTNAGAHLPLHLQGQMGSATITLSPGGSVPLVMGPTVVRFAAGGTSYELEILVDLDDVVAARSRKPPGDTTIDAGETSLTADQLLLLVALSEPRLRKGQAADLPTNAELMGRFGWSVTKFNRKLDSLCAKFARRGVSGLVGSADRMAQARRSVLVDHVIASGMVTVDQLSLLPSRQGTGPSRSSAGSIPS